MRRRTFIAGLGSAAAWPLAARGQQPTTVVELLSSQGAESIIVVEPFRQGLKETSGFIEGQNIVIEYRWAENQIDRLPGLATDLVRRRVAAIAAFSVPATRAAKAATNTIPIVFAMGGDPVSLGFVASLNRPGGNVTGYANLQDLLVPKRLQLLRDLKPDAALIGFLTNPADPSSEADTHDLLAAAGTAQKILVLSAGSDSELERAFEVFVR